MKHCSACGYKRETDHNFCATCGHRFISNTSHHKAILIVGALLAVIVITYLLVAYTNQLYPFAKAGGVTAEGLIKTLSKIR